MLTAIPSLQFSGKSSYRRSEEVKDFYLLLQKLRLIFIISEIYFDFTHILLLQ